MVDAVTNKDNFEKVRQDIFDDVAVRLQTAETIEEPYKKFVIGIGEHLEKLTDVVNRKSRVTDGVGTQNEDA